MEGDTRGQGSRVSRVSRVTDRLGNPPRRLLLVGGGAAALALLVDAGLRVDVPQPPPPVPTRRPVPDEALLLSVVADLTGIVADETALISSEAANAVVRQLRVVHREQRRVLIGRLTNDGVPSKVITAATRAASTSGDVKSRSQLADRLAEVAPMRWREIAAATPANRGLLTDVYAVRLAGALRLGHDVDLPEPASPVRPQVVTRTQPLVYAFEVAAAQAATAVQRRLVATLAELTRLEIAASGAATSAPDGWALPYPVTSTADAERLAHDTLSSAVDASAELAASATTAASVEDVATWSARVQALAVPWDVPLTAFPGAEE